jgi:hypothetical protein
MVVRWEFEDPVTLDVYTFAVNPSDGGSPGYAKNITSQATSAPEGKVIRFEGQDSPQQMEFSGTLFTEAEYNAFVEWWDKRYQVLIRDDLGREFYIEIDQFEPSRKRARAYPWKHEYKVVATIVDWPA